MATTNDLKNGIVLNLDGQLWTVTEFQHVKPGKGGAFVRTTLKNVLVGQGRRQDLQRRHQGRDGQRRQAVDDRTCTRTAPTSSSWTATPTTRSTCPAETVGEGANYLLENTEVTVAVHDGTPLYVELPVTMELVVEHTDPGLQGDRSTGGTKPATLETGAQIQVPLFITTGEKLKVDTRDGRYLGRVN